MEIKNKSKLPRLTMLLVALLVLVGASYAYFDYSFIGKDNTISTTDVSIKLLESNKEIITLENQLPISDEQGMTQEGTSNVFDFAVETKSSSDMKLGYKLSIEKLQTDTGYTSLTDDQIKIYLTDTDNNKILGPLKISELDNYNLYEDVNIHSKTNNTQVDKYRIRVWIDQDVQVKEWNENTKQQYKFKIGVGSTENEGNYIITYSPNGGEGQMAASVYNQNTTNTLRKNTFTKGGYTFKGWSTTKDGEVEYQDQNAATNLTTTQNEQNRTLYAVWQPNTYTVKYHPNGGIGKTEEPLVLDTDYYPWDGENNNKWSLVNGVYESKDQDTTSAEQTSSSKTSNVKQLSTQYIESYMYKEVNLSEETELTFDYALPYGQIILFNYPIVGYKNTKIGSISQETETNVTYNHTSIILPQGNYYLGIIYTDDLDPYYGLAPAAYDKNNKTPPIVKKLDTTESTHKGYIKNLKLVTYSDEIVSSEYTVGQNNTLKTNQYIKDHHTFKGWNTNKNETEIQYTNESDLTNLEAKVKENEQIDLYAIWEVNKYNVNVVVKNGTINGDSTKQVEYDQNGVFNLTSNIDSNYGKVTCTNNQSGTIENGVLTIYNVSSDTTCTAEFLDEMTTVYKDGTLIINEQMKNRSANIATHGKVINEYDAMSDSNSYVFDHDDKPIWINSDIEINVIEVDQKIYPVSTAYWFSGLRNVKSGNFEKLETSSVTDMSSMFNYTGYDATTFELKGLENWNTSSVTDMSSMFTCAGYSAVTWNIGYMSNWNVSSVTDMSSIFSGAGNSAATWNIGDISNWDVSSVTDMSAMFFGAGKSATTWTIGDISNWNVSNVTDMGRMFNYTGMKAKTFVLNVPNWNTSKVTDMNSIFTGTGANATNVSLNLSNWDISNITDMSSMFENAARYSNTFYLNISGWDTSKVKYMGSMFSNTGYSATTWSVIIPKKTGSLFNTLRKLYGASESVYGFPNSTGKSFTLAS